MPQGATPTRVLILTGDPIREQMAGPAIRVWNMAEQLSAVADVRVVSWNRIDRRSERFGLHFVHESDDRAIAEHEQWADVLVVQGMSLRIFPAVRSSTKLVVVDLYDPFQLEQLEQNKYEDARTWADETAKAVSLLNEQLGRGDFFLCASDRQRDLWLGGLSSLGRLNPLTYADDPTFERLIALAPFGVPADPPVQRRHAIKGVVDGIAETDTVLLWGGGIYNWFDPVTLIEAMALLRHDHPEIKLFFLSSTHFNPDVPTMAAVGDTLAAAEAAGLVGDTVFFNDRWVAYDDRVDHLLDADLGVSTHLVHAETRFSFRTRILDCFWAGIPVVASDGDAFADLIRDAGAGRVVAPGDPQALADAIVDVLRPEARSAAAAGALALGERFRWEHSLAALVEYCADPWPAADHDQAVRRGATTSNRFEAILAKPRGVQRDLALFGYYLRHGGLRLVRDKLRKRRERLTRERPTAAQPGSGPH